MKNKTTQSVYYQAHVERKLSWLLSGVMKSVEHVAFDRTLDKQKGIVEFFVPVSMEETFLQIMDYLKKEQVVLSLEKI